ncbi:MAG: hypothetical protein HKO66_01610, partial [Saprospiraceae bacterium]|nr:hypothetical protein [Saprospiraceae bacterium]
EGCLEKEMRIYENDGNSSWDFRMDAENTLIGINKYKIEKLNKYTISVCDSEYDRHEIKEILFDEETGVIQTTDYEDLMSTIYLDENERVIRRIDKYGQETITNYESEYSSKTYSKDKAGSLSLVFEFNQLFEENKIIKYRKSYGETIRDVKEVTYLK